MNIPVFYSHDTYTQINNFDLNISQNVWKFIIFNLFLRGWQLIKMVSIFLQCIWSVLWALAVYAVYWILVLTINPKWAVKSPQLNLKLYSIFSCSLTKWKPKSDDILFRWTSLGFLLQRLIEFTNLKSDKQIMVRNWNLWFEIVSYLLQFTKRLSSWN